ncbi:hypothetical protein K9M74_03900 [Candidatus Woesearchaeota archaeon]|nr:hypothetical protein [Candidatus Woesearchaeota archaeon]
MVKKHISKSKKHVTESNTTIILGVIFGLIILTIIVFGTYKLINQPKTDLSVYNGFAFEHRSNGKEEFWITQVQLEGEIYEVPFYNHPTQVEGYYYDDRITHYFLDLQIDEIVLAVHPDAGSIPVLAGINIARITGKLYGTPTSSALYVLENETFDLDMAQVNCADATGPRPIVWLTNITKEPSVMLSDDPQFCIYVSGQEKNILAAADLMAYKLLGIIK